MREATWWKGKPPRWVTEKFVWSEICKERIVPEGYRIIDLKEPFSKSEHQVYAVMLESSEGMIGYYEVLFDHFGTFLTLFTETP